MDANDTLARVRQTLPGCGRGPTGAAGHGRGRQIVFAVDSIPAVLGISTDPLVVYSSNIFAIMGLRALYTLVARAIERLAESEGEGRGDLKRALAVTGASRLQVEWR